MRKIIFCATLLLQALNVSAIDRTLKVRIFSKHPFPAAEVSCPLTQLYVDQTAVSGPVKLKVEKGRILVSLKGGEPQLQNTVKFESDGSFIRVTPKSKLPPRYFLGRVTVKVVDGNLFWMNEVSIDDYVSSVLIAEAAQIKEPEALRAMAIASRSYAVAESERHKKDGYDFCDLTHCQVYRNLGHLSDTLQQAVDDTKDLYLTYEDAIVPTYYHAACGGSTESAQDVWRHPEVPYLVAVSDIDPDTNRPYCEISPQFTWKSKLVAAELELVAKSAGWLRSVEKLQGLKVIETSPSGRATKIQLTTEHNTRSVKGSTFFREIGKHFGWDKIKSTWLTVERGGSNSKPVFIFEGRGYGHGVGLCQNGAEGRARSGQSAEKILTTYFPGTEIKKR